MTESQPPQQMVDEVFERDHYRCVMCSTGTGLTIGHRQATGMGGRGPKMRPYTHADFVTQCALHNAGAETWDQDRALEHGHKVRRNTLRPMSKIPFYDDATGLYWMPDDEGKRTPVLDAEAIMVILAVNFGR